MFASLVENCIYDRLHDTALRQCLKQSKSAADAIRYSTLNAAMQGVLEAAMEVELDSCAEAVKAAAEAAKTGDTEGAENGNDDDEVLENTFMDEETAEAHKRWVAAAHAKAGVRRNRKPPKALNPTLLGPDGCLSRCRSGHIVH